MHHDQVTSAPAGRGAEIGRSERRARGTSRATPARIAPSRRRRVALVVVCRGSSVDVADGLLGDVTPRRAMR